MALRKIYGRSEKGNRKSRAGNSDSLEDRVVSFKAGEVSLCEDCFWRDEKSGRCTYFSSISRGVRGILTRVGIGLLISSQGVDVSSLGLSINWEDTDIPEWIKTVLSQIGFGYSHVWGLMLSDDLNMNWREFIYENTPIFSSKLLEVYEMTIGPDELRNPLIKLAQRVKARMEYNGENFWLVDAYISKPGRAILALGSMEKGGWDRKNLIGWVEKNIPRVRPLADSIRVVEASSDGYPVTLIDVVEKPVFKRMEEIASGSLVDVGGGQYIDRTDHTIWKAGKLGTNKVLLPVEDKGISQVVASLTKTQAGWIPRYLSVVAAKTYYEPGDYVEWYKSGKKLSGTVESMENDETLLVSDESGTVHTVSIYEVVARRVKMDKGYLTDFYTRAFGDRAFAEELTKDL